jgi:uncharacterized membrane protein (UPF0127 family)
MVNFKKTIVIILILSVSAFAQGKLRECRLSVRNNDGKKIYIKAEIADTDETRSRGLMFRERMDADRGMLFVFEKSRTRSFWMKNTCIPLDIAYINENGIINEIYTMKPLDYSITYNSIKPAMFALEVNAGWFKKNNISAGSKIEFYGCFSK